MKIPSYLPPNAKEVSGVPQEGRWVDAALEYRDRTLRNLVQALSGRLSADNLNEEIKTVEVLHDTEVEVALNTLKGDPIGAWVVWSSLYDYLPSLAWKRSDSGKVRLKCKWASSPGTPTNVTILFRGA